MLRQTSFERVGLKTTADNPFTWTWQADIKQEEYDQHWHFSILKYLVVVNEMKIILGDVFL